MSEYQYYEFRAIDRPLTKQEMAEVRSLSTRATITPTRFVNVYHWGDFKGNPFELVKRYYDAFLYVANWGTHELMLRLPRAVLSQETGDLYSWEGGPFSVNATKEHIILSFDSHAEDPEDWEDWDEDEEWLAILAPLRAEIASGDLRGLYLGWLLCVQEGLLDDDDVEPPVPFGLGEPSASLQGLMEFLRIEEDLLEAAAEGSPAMPELPETHKEAQRWLRGLSEAEKDGLLLRLASGDVHLHAEVRRRVRESGTEAFAGMAQGQRRTVGELLAGVDRRRRQREQRAAEEREQLQQAQAAAQAAYLDSLAGQQEDAWLRVEAFVESKRQAEYAEAVQLLTNLRDLAAREQAAEGFETRLKELRTRHARKISFLDRLKQANLLPA